MTRKVAKPEKAKTDEHGNPVSERPVQRKDGDATAPLRRMG